MRQRHSRAMLLGISALGSAILRGEIPQVSRLSRGQASIERGCTSASSGLEKHMRLILETGAPRPDTRVPIGHKGLGGMPGPAHESATLISYREGFVAFRVARSRLCCAGSSGRSKGPDADGGQCSGTQGLSGSYSRSRTTQGPHIAGWRARSSGVSGWWGRGTRCAPAGPRC